MLCCAYEKHLIPPPSLSSRYHRSRRLALLPVQLNFRDVEDLLAERGIDVSYETVRRWCSKFGPAYAQRLRKRREQPSKTWHIDEVFLRIGGRQMFLWRLVDNEGEVLDVLLQAKRNKRAATKFLRRAIKKHSCVPAQMVSDKWRPTRAAILETVPCVEHVMSKRLNNRADNSHQPTRRRERKQQRFKTAKSTQRFLSTFTAFYNQFNIQRHLLSRTIMKAHREQALASWASVSAAK